MKSPAFQFYPDNWLGGTMGMSFEEQGAYLNLLILQNQKGPFSESQAKNLLGSNYEKLWATLKEKFISDRAGNFFNERLVSEQEKRKTFSKLQKERADKRWHKSGIDPASFPAMPVEIEIGIEIKNEIDSAITENGKMRFHADAVADFFSDWLTRLNIPNKREYFIQAVPRSNRIDVMIFDNSDNERIIVEVKNYRGHDDYHKELKQINRYSEIGLPILFLPSIRQSEECLYSILNYFNNGSYDRNFVFIPKGFSKEDNTSLPLEMLKIWVDAKPNYAVDKLKDLPALQGIKEFILEQAKKTKSDPHFETVVDSEILDLWQQIMKEFLKDKFWCNKSLSSFGNSIQEFWNKANKNGQKQDSQTASIKRLEELLGYGQQHGFNGN